MFFIFWGVTRKQARQKECFLLLASQPSILHIPNHPKIKQKHSKICLCIKITTLKNVPSCQPSLVVVVMVDILSLKKVDIVASLARPRITSLPVTMALTSTTRSVTSPSCMDGIGRWKRRGQNASECARSQTEK